MGGGGGGGGRWGRWGEVGKVGEVGGGGEVGEVVCCWYTSLLIRSLVLIRMVTLMPEAFNFPKQWFQC